jgi:hypothetical protein
MLLAPCCKQTVVSYKQAPAEHAICFCSDCLLILLLQAYVYQQHTFDCVLVASPAGSSIPSRAHWMRCPSSHCQTNSAQQAQARMARQQQHAASSCRASTTLQKVSSQGHVSKPWFVLSVTVCCLHELWLLLQPPVQVVHACAPSTCRSGADTHSCSQ